MHEQCIQINGPFDKCCLSWGILSVHPQEAPFLFSIYLGFSPTNGRVWSNQFQPNSYQCLDTDMETTFSTRVFFLINQRKGTNLLSNYQQLENKQNTFSIQGYLRGYFFKSNFSGSPRHKVRFCTNYGHSPTSYSFPWSFCRTSSHWITRTLSACFGSSGNQPAKKNSPWLKPFGVFVLGWVQARGCRVETSKIKIGIVLNQFAIRRGSDQGFYCASGTIGRGPSSKVVILGLVWGINSEFGKKSEEVKQERRFGLILGQSTWPFLVQWLPNEAITNWQFLALQLVLCSNIPSQQKFQRFSRVWWAMFFLDIHKDKNIMPKNVNSLWLQHHVVRKMVQTDLGTALSVRWHPNPCISSRRNKSCTFSLKAACIFGCTPTWE